MLRGRSKKLMGTKDSQSFQSIRVLGHRRGFSFFPGYDSASPLLFSALGGQGMESETNFIRPLAWQEMKQSECGGSGESKKQELPGGMAVISTSQQRLSKSAASSTTGSDFSRNL